MEDQTQEITTLKREVDKFVKRFTFGYEMTKERLALFWYLLDEFHNYTDNLQATIGQQLLDTDFEKVYLIDRNKKVFLDNENGILIDNITENEKNKLREEESIRRLEQLYDRSRNKT